MLKRYLNFKLKSDDFVNNVKNILNILENKKVVVVYDDKKTFIFLDKIFNISKRVKIVRSAISYKEKEVLNAVTSMKIDAILVLSEHNPELFAYKINCIMENKNIPIYIPFKENLRDAQINLEYLLKYNIEKSIKNLIKNLKNKKVIFYGGGLLFKLVNEYYDLSKLNVIGVADKKLNKYSKIDNVCGYKLYAPEDIKALEPDYVIITTKLYLETANSLYEEYLKHSKIKIISLVKKNIIAAVRGG